MAAVLFGIVGIAITGVFEQVAPAMVGYLAIEAVIELLHLPKDGWNAVPLVIGVNGALYATVGFCLARRANSLRLVLRRSCVLAAALIALSVVFDVAVPYVRDARYLRDMVRQNLAAVEADPEDIQSLFWLGIHYFRVRGGLVEAERYFTKVLETESDDSQYSMYAQRCLLCLALNHLSQGRTDQADSEYRSFLATDPDLAKDAFLAYWNKRYIGGEGPDP